MRASMVGIVAEVSDIFFECSRRMLKSIEVEFVRIAPAPVFPGLKRLHNRMFDMPIVLAGMFVLGRIAAADVSAGKAEAKVDPAVAHLETLLAAVAAGGNFMNLAQVRTSCGSHRIFLLS